MTVVVGCAVQGRRGTGVTAGCSNIFAYILRPKVIADCLWIFQNTCEAVRQLLVPFVGGVFTQDLRWR